MAYVPGDKLTRQQRPLNLSTSTIFDFQTSDVSRALALHVGFSKDGGSWDEMGMCCDNVKPAN